MLQKLQRLLQRWFAKVCQTELQSQPRTSALDMAPEVELEKQNQQLARKRKTRRKKMAKAKVVKKGSKKMPAKKGKGC